MIFRLNELTPKIHASAFVAPDAIVVGDVEIGEDSSVWFSAVVRGDVNRILIGKRSNIQDGCVLHVNSEGFSLEVGDEVTVGHGVILHGCTVEDGCLIGMGARILDGARVEKFSLVAAGSLVREGQRVPSYSLVAGVPAVVKRKLTDAEVEKIRRAAESYVQYKEQYRSGLVKME
ncbi:MAG: gamma carbonic anhydrase family protein [Calditrichaeota bacterium]|nr:MAG: gamma carbonic anhydrase family protein [Calditrichota bacterium]